MLRPRAVGPIPYWSDDKQRVDSMVGIEWYGADSLTAALEIVNRHWLDLPRSPDLLEFFEQSVFETGLRVSRPFFRERLDVTLLGVVFGERAQDGGLFRASGEWEISNSWKVESGWLVFIGGPDKAIGATTTRTTASTSSSNTASEQRLRASCLSQRSNPAMRGRQRAIPHGSPGVAEGSREIAVGPTSGPVPTRPNPRWRALAA